VVQPVRRRSAVLAWGALLLAGCGSGGVQTPLPAGPTTAQTPAAGTADASAEEAVLTGYLAYWDGVIQAHRRGDPADRRLAAHTGDPELSRVRAEVARNSAQRLSVRGSVRHTARTETLSGSTATVLDCYDISGWNPVNVDTGKRVDTVGGSAFRARYTLRRSRGTWIVVDSVVMGGC